MTKDEIFKMAKEVYGETNWTEASLSRLEAFAKLVAAKAIAELKSQEPMLLFQSHRDNFWCVDLTCKKCYSADFRLMHTHPPQRTWVGLTSTDWFEALKDIDPKTKRLPQGFSSFACAIEAKLKQKNGFPEEKNT